MKFDVFFLLIKRKWGKINRGKHKIKKQMYLGVEHIINKKLLTM